jgi:hypothetical protein
MVDDEIGHDVRFGGERHDVVPVAEARVDARVVARIEACIGAVDRVEEGQDVNAGEEAAERPPEQGGELGETAAR